MQEAVKVARAVEAWNAYRILVGICLRKHRHGSRGDGIRGWETNRTMLT
jgi:hypothetical protein